MTNMIWTPERIAQARQRNFGESVTLTAQNWDAMLDMAERYSGALEAIASEEHEQQSPWPPHGMLKAGLEGYECRKIAKRALDGGWDE